MKIFNIVSTTFSFMHGTSFYLAEMVCLFVCLFQRSHSYTQSTLRPWCSSDCGVYY